MTLQLGVPHERFREESAFWRELVSLVFPFVLALFQNSAMPFPTQKPSQAAGKASNGEEIISQLGKKYCKQAACSWHTSLHRAIYQKSMDMDSGSPDNLKR